MSQEHKEDGELREVSGADILPKKSHKKVYFVAFITLIVLGLSIFVYLYANSSKSPLANYEDAIGFQLYYPDPIPSEYTLDKESVTSDESVLFFTLRKMGDTVVISQQKSPDIAPDFNKLKESLDFKDIESENGSAVNGLNNGLPSAILLTNTTLITVNGSKEVPSDVVVELIKNMRSL